MLPKLLPLCALVALPFAPGLTEAPVDPLAPERDMASLFPERTLVYVEAPGLPALLDEGLDHPAVAAVLGSEIGRAALAESGQDPEALLAFGALALGRPVLPTLSSLTANGVALGVAFGRGGPVVALALHADDDLLVEELLERASAFLEDETGVAGLFDEPHATVRGADVWYLEETVLARRDALVVAGNDEGFVRDVLDQAADASAEGLAGSARFQRARAGAAGDDLLWAFADRVQIEELTAGRPGGGDLAEFYAMGRQPEVHFLLGPGFAALSDGEAYSAALRLDGTSLGVSVRAHGAEPYADVAPALDATPPAALAGGDGVASALLYRDLGGVYAHRAELFDAETLPQISKGLSELSLLFGGVDLGEDLFPHLSPWMRLVARPASFDEGLRPEVELPAAALLVDVDDPATTGQTLVSAFQNAVALANVTQAQEGMSAMTLRISLEGETQVTSAHWPPPGPDDGVDVRHNLAPACALVGDTFVLGTHVSLVKEVVRDLGAGRTSSRATGVGEHLEVSGPALARVVAANLETLVAQKVLDEGLTPAEARQEMEGLRMLCDAIERARLAVSYDADGVALSLDADLAASETREF